MTETVSLDVGALPRPSSFPVEPSGREPESTQPVIAIVGLGYVGLPTALTASARGARTIGVDSSESRLKAIRDNDQASNVMSAQNSDDCEARVAHRIQHESLVRPGRQPCRSGITVNRPRAILRRGMDRKVKSQIQVVHAIEDQRLALSQTQASSLGYDLHP